MSGEDSDGRIGLDAAIASLISDDDKPGDSSDDNIHLLSKNSVNFSLKRKQDELLGQNKTKYCERTEDPPLKYQGISEEDGNNSAKRSHTSSNHGDVVAEHYNKLEEKGLDERLKSKIFFLRNFNNWIKSMLIAEYLNKARGSKSGAPLKVLDMCCGKGGDLLKWQKSNITHLICADIASTSIGQCETRYKEMLSRGNRERDYIPLFSAEFISADCTTGRLREKYKDASVELDLVSCQFAFHYSFETLPQAECMLRNAAECLKTGGFFIGTMPDAYEIMKRQKQAQSPSFGNDVYKIEFQVDVNKTIQLFGAKYMFSLEGVVDCPEFLVHFPTFVKLAKRYGLKLISKDRFEDVFNKNLETGRGLLGKMQCLETYPPFPHTSLTSAPEDYEHAKKYMADPSKPVQSDQKYRKVGTLSKSEWEAASLYLTFAFEKVKTSWDSEGKPIYQ